MKEPEIIIYLYKKINSSRFKGEQSEKLCRFLLDHIDFFGYIPENLTYAGEVPKSFAGWKYLNYRCNSRKGYPKKNNIESLYGNTSVESEKHLAMRIFRQVREKSDLAHPAYLDKIGFILDYEMPIGGTKTLLKIKDGDEYDKDDENYPYGIYVPQKSFCLFKPGKCDLVAYDKERFIFLEVKKARQQRDIASGSS